jgi:Cupin domain
MTSQPKHLIRAAALGFVLMSGSACGERGDAAAAPDTAGSVGSSRGGSSASVAWLGDSASDFKAPGFAAGARMAVLHGNPADSGNFVLRLDFPDGYVIPPHWHPTTEFVTVLEGTFVIGMGEQADRTKAQSLGAGRVAAAPARMPHYAWAQGRTVVQVHGVGPFQLNLVGKTQAN